MGNGRLEGTASLSEARLAGNLLACRAEAEGRAVLLTVDGLSSIGVRRMNTYGDWRMKSWVDVMLLGDFSKIFICLLGPKYNVAVLPWTG